MVGISTSEAISLHQSTHFEPSITKIGSGVQAVDDGKNKKGKERKRYYKNAQKCYISHPFSEGPNDTIFTKFGTVVDLTWPMQSLVGIG